MQNKVRKRKKPFDRTQNSTFSRHTDNFSTAHDHTYDLPSQGELKRRFDIVMKENAVLKKKLKLALQAKRKLTKRCKFLRKTVETLKEKNLVTKSVVDLLNQAKSKVPAHLLDMVMKSQKGKRKRYSKDLKSFALTLQFYSSKAYNFVRDTFDQCLPHENVVRRWYSKVDADTGFSVDALKTLDQKVKEEMEKGKQVIVNLVFDEVSIRKKIEWSGKRFIGCVDIGTGAEPDDLTPPATEALVIMVVAIDNCWKISIGYFLIAHLNADEKVSILNNAFYKLFKVGVIVANVTCDGLAANFSTLSKLGANFDPSSFCCTFPNPANPSHKVTVMLDACHLLKLARNTLSDYKVLIDPDGQRIEWRFVENLHKVQQKEGLRAANKLKNDHIAFHKQKMKVKLAAQTLSSSVADAIDFCRESLDLPDFRQSEATTKFIRIIDALFDTMNSRNPLGRGYKSPMKQSNEHLWSSIFANALGYLDKIKDLQGKKMIYSLRKTAFIGFLINIHSLQYLYKSLVLESKVKYLLTYKFSQDHLELFFSAIRGRLGSNNNPTCREFQAAFKRLLLHQEIRGNRGNCILQDDTSLLTFTTKSQQNLNQQSLCDFDLQKKFGLAYEETDHDYIQISCFPLLSEFQTSVLEYISGFSVRMAAKLLHCESCLEAIFEPNPNSGYKLVMSKDKGGLIHVSPSVRIVAKVTEQALQTVMKTTAGLVTFKNDLSAAVTTFVLKTVMEQYP